MQMLASLIASVVSGEASETVAAARRTAIVYAIAGLFFLCGLGFLVGAGFVMLAREIGTVAAALWTGGGFIVVGLVLVLVHRITARARARQAARRRSSEVAALASAAAFAALPAMLAGRGRALALAGPLLAGLAYAVYRENRPHAREGDSTH